MRWVSKRDERWVRWMRSVPKRDARWVSKEMRGVGSMNKKWVS
jgi:hypothetical protein